MIWIVLTIVTAIAMILGMFKLCLFKGITARLPQKTQRILYQLRGIIYMISWFPIIIWFITKIEIFWIIWWLLWGLALFADSCGNK